MVTYKHPMHGRCVLNYGDDPKRLEAAGWVREEPPAAQRSEPPIPAGSEPVVSASSRPPMPVPSQGTPNPVPVAPRWPVRHKRGG